MFTYPKAELSSFATAVYLNDSKILHIYDSGEGSTVLAPSEAKVLARFILDNIP